MRSYRIAVAGLGYVGLSVAIGLSSLGYRVIGVDVDEEKVNSLSQGLSPYKNELVGRMLPIVTSKGLFRVTTSYKEAVENSDVAFICVPTPWTGERIDLTCLLDAYHNILENALGKEEYLIVVKSTVPPNTFRDLLIPIRDNLSKNAKIRVCHNPEFLREDRCLEDFLNPEVIVIGCDDVRSFEILKDIYDPIIQRSAAKVFKVDFTTAEFVKYVFNAFHASKISFMLEMTLMAKKLGVDIFSVSEILVSDHKLNISPAYLRPGFSFGGPCLTKDLKGIISLAKSIGVQPTFMQSILDVNEAFKRSIAKDIISVIKSFDVKSVALIGIGYKSKADDVRESPLVDLLDLLLPHVNMLMIYDKYLNDQSLCFLNKKYSDGKVMIMDNVGELVLKADMLILAYNYVKIEDIVASLERVGKNKKLVLYDLTGHIHNIPCSNRVIYISAFR